MHWIVHYFFPVSFRNFKFKLIYCHFMTFTSELTSEEENSERLQFSLNSQFSKERQRYNKNLLCYFGRCAAVTEQLQTVTFISVAAQR